MNLFIIMNAQDTKTETGSGTGRLRGGRWGIWFYHRHPRTSGLRATYALAVFPAIYFPSLRRTIAATMDFHRRIFIVAVVETPLVRFTNIFILRPRDHQHRTAILAGKKAFHFFDEKSARRARARSRRATARRACRQLGSRGQLLSRVDVPSTSPVLMF